MEFRVAMRRGLARLREDCPDEVRQAGRDFGVCREGQKENRLALRRFPYTNGDMQVKHDYKGFDAASARVSAQNGFTTTSITIAIIATVGNSFTTR